MEPGSLSGLKVSIGLDCRSEVAYDIRPAGHSMGLPCR